MEQKRRPFQGVLNILSFNRHFYFMGISVLAFLIFMFAFFQLPTILCWIVLVAFLYGLIMPLIISAFVYDFSGYYDFKWLDTVIREKEGVKHIVNINAGFDESSFILHDRFPGADLNVFDFYDAKRHTEPAIIRARKVSLVYPETKQISSDSIPLPDTSVDIIFLLSAVHEIRSFDEKITFLSECHRICKKEGQVIMVEHLRDFPNFLAFTVGFTHFFSRATWKNAFESAGFASFEEIKFPPFMSICISRSYVVNQN